MDKQNITADWARKQATTILGEKIKKQTNACLSAIEEAVSKNQMSTSIDFHLHDLTIEDLSNRGFIVKSFHSQKDGVYALISW